MPKIKLTDTLVRRLEADPDKHIQHRDAEVAGYALLVTRGGAKSFVLNYSLHGRERRMTIGAFPAWSVMAAREEAKRLRRLIDQGEDPLAQRENRAAAPTLHDLWADYSTRHLPTLSPKNVADQRSIWSRHVLPQLGRTKLQDLTSKQVDDLHRRISQSAPVSANRAVASLRKALNLAKRSRWVESNAAEGVRKNSEHQRERYLSVAERERLAAALERMANQQAANAIRLLLLTGARKSEVFGATWGEFDLAAAIWTKPRGRVKTRRDTRVPLSTAAVELLTRMKAASRSELLFPSRTGTPIPDIKAPWSWLLKEAQLADFRIHDLRHSFASTLVSGGETLEIIGRLLGHTQMQTTARYAHLMDDPLRAAVEKAAPGHKGSSPRVARQEERERVADIAPPSAS